MKNDIQIIDYYFCVKIDFSFEFLLLSFAFHFPKKWKTKYSSFFFFCFHEGIKKRVTSIDQKSMRRKGHSMFVLK